MKKRKLLGIGILLLLLLGGIFAFRAGKKYFEIAKSLDQMAAVYRDLNTYYVDSLDPSELMESGIRAMTQALDPYTVFYPEEDIQKLKFIKTGKYAGIGASFRIIHDSIFVSSMFPDAPLRKIGVIPGDIILSLNDSLITGLRPMEVHQLLRGNPGSDLKIVAKSPWTGKIRTGKVKRKMIEVPSVPYKAVLQNHIGYIKFQQFTEGSALDFKSAFASLEAKDSVLSALIVDLRNNPGGLLQEAVRMSNYFLPLGDTIVSVKGRNPEWDRVYTAINKPLDTLIRLVVLINGQSASAAEIFSGAMQDLDRGVIVGRRSFGKGLVQGTRKLPYNGRLKLTVGRYYTPSGRCIQAIDYSRKNIFGKPIHIADSLRDEFLTSDGRVVTDNGGIKPDKAVKQQYLSNVSNALINHDLYFRFATRYLYLHPTAPPLADFEISDSLFKRFESFVGNYPVNYKSRGELLLDRFRADAISDGYFDSVKVAYRELTQQIHKYTPLSLKKHRKEVSELLAKEIMNSYYNLPGSIAVGISTDQVVNEAVAILMNQQQYNKMLR